MDSGAPEPRTGFVLNGQQIVVSPGVGERLSDTLRERLGARDVKVGCNAGDCGACTVLVDGAPICACLMPTQQAAGARVETLAGLVQGDTHVAALREAFQNHGAAQCGICTPGMMVSAVALLRSKSRPDIGTVEEALSGVLCRCTGYRKIMDAVLEAGGTCAFQAPDGSGEIGTSIRRLDGLAKVEGRETFADDIAPPETLVVRVVRSSYPRAGFVFGDIDGFVAAHDGVEAVLTAADVPGRNCFGVIPPFADQPVFAEAETRFRGEAVAAVIGTPTAMRAFDVSRFPIAWDERPGVRTVAEALAQAPPGCILGAVVTSCAVGWCSAATPTRRWRRPMSRSKRASKPVLSSTPISSPKLGTPSSETGGSKYMPAPRRR